MNVLIISSGGFWSLGEGSGAASFFQSARGFVDHGHVVAVLMPKVTEGPTRNGEIYHGMSLFRFPMRSEVMLKGTGTPLGFLRRAYRLVSYYREASRTGLQLAEGFQPDVVVAFGPHSAPVARRIAKKLRVSNVTRLFGQSLILYMDPSGKIRDPLRFLANFPEVIAFRTPCDALICHDDGSRGDVVARYLGVPQDRFHFWRDGFDIPEPIDLAQRARFRQALGISPERVVALSLGRLVVEKGLERILASLERISAAVPALDVAFVGEGPIRNALEQRSRETGLTDRVRFLAAVRRDELDKIFGASDFLVSTCDRTNVTNSTMDGMAAGLPAVALDTGTTSSVIHHEKTGLLVPPGDPAALDRELTRLASDTALRERLGREARALVAREFPRVSQRVKREVELVASLVADSNGPAHGQGGRSAEPFGLKPRLGRGRLTW
jgi:glycosyltransferase involved in cell wall biosynthesis